MTKATLPKVRAYAEELGATVEHQREGDSWVIRVEAPHGFKWHEGGVHEIVAYAYAPWRPDYSDVYGRMQFGLYPCEDQPKCDWCNPEWSEAAPNA